MSEPIDMRRLRAEHLARRARNLVIVESVVILGLLLALTLQYENDTYMRLWIAANIWPVEYLLNGTVLGLISGVLIGWIVAKWHARRSREQKILDDLRKII